MANNEIWKKIEENPRYEVSSLGRVRKSAYWCVYDTGHREYYEAIEIIPIPGPNGVLYVNFESRHVAVHLLVAHAFLEEPEVPSFVQFLDEDNSNCCATNLKYVSVSNFTKQKIANGSRAVPKPYKGKPIICVETGEIYGSIKALCESIGLRRYLVTPRIISGEPINNKHYKYYKVAK
jgi:hypothetical protein